MQGLGNDFVVLDALALEDSPPVEGWHAKPDGVVDFAKLAIKLCQQRFSVGADGLLLLSKVGPDRFRMDVWNQDGSTTEMCGNGLRCCAYISLSRGYWKDRTTFEVGNRELVAEPAGNGCMRVGMGSAKFLRNEIGLSGDPATDFVNQDIGFGLMGSAVSIGNPHLVIFTENASQDMALSLGPKLEHFSDFPNATNVQFAKILDRENVELHIWERGAGPTKACGSGACATVAMGVKLGLVSGSANVHMPGGSLKVDIDAHFGIMQTGPAAVVFGGRVEL